MHWLRELGGPSRATTRPPWSGLPPPWTGRSWPPCCGPSPTGTTMLRGTLVRTAADAWTGRGPGARTPWTPRPGSSGSTSPGWTPTALRTVVAERARAARATLDPDAGAMVRAVWFDAGGEPGRLLLMAHHLVIDGVSWRVLLPDLAAAWQDVAAGRPAELPPVDTSFRTWSRQLTELAQDPAREAELPFWTGVLDGAAPFPLDRPLDPDRDTVGTVRELALRLPADQTGPLLSAVPAAFGANVNDVLLTGLGLAVADWRRRHGDGSQAPGPRRPRRPRPRGGAGGGRRSVPYGRLVHQRLPGPPGHRSGRPGRRVRGRPGRGRGGGRGTRAPGLTARERRRLRHAAPPQPPYRHRSSPPSRRRRSSSTTSAGSASPRTRTGRTPRRRTSRTSAPSRRCGRATRSASTS